MKSSLVVLRKRNRETADMDITPMIDITFLLLIFFLVCSSIDKMSSIELPPAYSGTAVSERDSVVFTVDGSGMDSVVYIGNGTGTAPLSANKETQEREIVDAVEAGFKNGKAIVVIRASGDLFHAEVNRIETAASIPGVKTLHLAVKETK